MAYLSLKSIYQMAGWREQVVTLPLPRVTHSNPRGHRPALCAYPMNDPRGRTRQAHCVVLWGGDFRPEYSRLGELRERLGVPWLMLTATLPPAMRVQASPSARAAGQRGSRAAALPSTLTPAHARAVIREPKDRAGKRRVSHR